MLVDRTLRPGAPNLVCHVILDLERDVGGDVRDGLRTVERECVTAEPTRQRLTALVSYFDLK